MKHENYTIGHKAVVNVSANTGRTHNKMETDKKQDLRVGNIKDRSEITLLWCWKHILQTPGLRSWNIQMADTGRPP